MLCEPIYADWLESYNRAAAIDTADYGTLTLIHFSIPIHIQSFFSQIEVHLSIRRHNVDSLPPVVCCQYRHIVHGI